MHGANEDIWQNVDLASPQARTQSKANMIMIKTYETREITNVWL